MSIMNSNVSPLIVMLLLSIVAVMASADGNELKLNELSKPTNSNTLNTRKTEIRKVTTRRVKSIPKSQGKDDSGDAKKSPDSSSSKKSTKSPEPSPPTNSSTKSPKSPTREPSSKSSKTTKISRAPTKGMKKVKKSKSPSGTVTTGPPTSQAMDVFGSLGIFSTSSADEDTKKTVIGTISAVGAATIGLAL